MKSIAQILNSQPRPSALARGVEAALVVEAANECLKKMFGSEISAAAQAIYFKEGILAIACLSSTAAQQIKLEEARLIGYLDQKFKTGLITKIRFET